MGHIKVSYGDDSETIKMKDYEDDLGFECNRFDVGICPGVTVWYNDFGVDFSFQRGLMTAVKEEEVYTNNIQIRLAYRF